MLSLPALFLLFSVLIETSWNVKIKQSDSMIIHISINRNIVECKEICRWNSSTYKVVLIETSWNVKYCRLAASNHSACGINRNIVECKER